MPKDEENFWQKTMNQKRVMKDLNFLEINKSFDYNFV